jgi:nicotinamide-nucleotide amidase
MSELSCRIELIATGNEVLQGETPDTNSAWIATTLNDCGLNVQRTTTVGDDLKVLRDLFLERAAYADIILVNGGLGPTVDDLSAQAMSEALQAPLVVNEFWVKELKERFGDRPLSNSNLKQALLPAGFAPLPNPIGTACGFFGHLKGCRFFFTPGVPSEMKRMVTEQVLPRIQDTARPETLTDQRAFCFGLAESHLNEILSPLAQQNEVNLGFRASFPLIEIKLKGPSDGVVAMVEAMRPHVADHLCQHFGPPVPHLISLLKQSQATLGLAESCTGGLISDFLVRESGVSEVYRGAIVCYANEVKERLLGVPQDILLREGAVSEATVQAMASGVRRLLDTTYALAVSGVAGPTGGSEEKPVGTMSLALATPERLFSQILQLPPWERQRLRQGAAMAALDMLRRFLENKPVFGAFDYGRRLKNTTQEVTP